MSGESNTDTTSSTSHGREFDVVVYGASGFVGELTARYLADHAPIGTKIALAGRNESKLTEARKRLPLRAHDWPLIIADAESPAALDAMVARTQVVCTTVGPYLKYGEALIVAAATAGAEKEVPLTRQQEVSSQSTTTSAPGADRYQF